MHRRASLRYPAVFKVVLYQDDHPIAQCNAKNVCRDGVFVQTQNIELSPDVQLDIEFEVTEGDSRKRARLPASVIHQSEQGLGLRFMEPKTRDEVLAHALLGYANRRFRVYHNPANTTNHVNLPGAVEDWRTTDNTHVSTGVAY
ncbi:MAG: PilZ domain-containing protein [Gammaproteobacteria bacterium]|jgi:hypothetical protein